MLAICMRQPKYWSLSFNIRPCSEYSRLISFRIDWFDFLAGQGALKSLLQHHSSKASILWQLAFFMAQLSHSYMTTGKTIALTIWTFAGKVTSMLFNMLFYFFIALLLISWLQSPFVVIFEPKKIEPVPVCIVFPSIRLEVMGPDVMIFVS